MKSLVSIFFKCLEFNNCMSFCKIYGSGVITLFSGLPVKLIPLRMFSFLNRFDWSHITFNGIWLFPKSVNMPVRQVEVKFKSHVSLISSVLISL